MNCRQDEIYTRAERAMILNRLKTIKEPGEAERNEIVRWAERLHADYPQYANYWDGWGLARAKKRITTKGGLCCERGDILLVSETARIIAGLKRPNLCLSLYSLRSNTNYLIDHDDFEIVWIS